MRPDHPEPEPNDGPSPLALAAKWFDVLQALDDALGARMRPRHRKTGEWLDTITRDE